MSLSLTLQDERSHNLSLSPSTSQAGVDFSRVKFAAVLVFHDSRDWGRDIQLVTDLVQAENGVFGTGKDPSNASLWTPEKQLPVFFSNPGAEFSFALSLCPAFRSELPTHTIRSSVGQRLPATTLRPRGVSREHGRRLQDDHWLRTPAVRPLLSSPYRIILTDNLGTEPPAANLLGQRTNTVPTSSTRPSKRRRRGVRSTCTRQRPLPSLDESTWSVTTLIPTLPVRAILPFWCESVRNLTGSLHDVVVGANAFGWESILVRTGVFRGREEDAAHKPTIVMPHVLVRSELLSLSTGRRLTTGCRRLCRTVSGGHWRERDMVECFRSDCRNCGYRVDVHTCSDQGTERLNLKEGRTFPRNWEKMR